MMNSYFSKYLSITSEKYPRKDIHPPKKQASIKVWNRKNPVIRPTQKPTHIEQESHSTRERILWKILPLDMIRVIPIQPRRMTKIRNLPR